MKRNKIFTTVAALLACAVANINISCADDTDIQNSKAGVDKNAIVVNTMTEQFENNETPDAKCTRVMDVQTSDGYTLKLMEIDYNFMDEPTQELAGVATRGKMIESANDIDIKTVGIYGYAAANSYSAIGTTANVVDNGNIDGDGLVKKDGSIKHWSPAISYAQFAAVYPRVENNGQVSEFARKGDGKFTFGCNIPQDCKQQKDLMFGYVQPKKYENKTAPQTTIALKHALTAINFAVGDNLSLGKKIDRIQLEDAGSSATCVAEVQDGGVTKMEWTDKQGAAKGIYRLKLSDPVATNTPGVMITGGEKGNRVDNTFFVIPRKEKTQDVNITVYYTDNTKMKVTIPKDKFKGWKPGHTITYMLTGKSNMNKILADNNRLLLTKDGRKIKSESASFNIKSYKFVKGTEGNLKQGENAVAKAWKVVNYRYKENGKEVNVSKNPDWFSLDKTEGKGGVTNEKITGTFHSEKIHHDLLKERNERLQKAKPADKKNLAGEVGKENTANSYIISAPGTYRLPLAYGNAIQNGQTAEKTFKVDGKNVFPTHNCNLVGTKTYNGYTIKVYEDKEFIDCGWIADKKNGKPANAYTPAKSKIVWTDIPNVVTLGAISPDKHFLNLTISNKIQNGNAVVAVMNENGEILWSWHLWFTDEQEAVKAGSSEVLGENLGWKYTAWSKDEMKEITVTLQQVDDSNAKTEVTFVRPELATIQGTSPFYQLFRFSPMSHEKTAKNEKKQTCYYNLVSFSCKKLESYGENGLKKVNEDIVYPSFGYAIQNPDLAFWNNDIDEMGFNYMWTIVKWDNRYFWRGKNGEKMVYDPCPHGYQVPTYQVLQNIKTAINGNRPYDDQVPRFRVGNKEYYLPHCGLFWGGASGQVTTDQTRYTSSDVMRRAKKTGKLSEYVTRYKSLRVRSDGVIHEQATVNGNRLDPNLAKNGGCIRPMKGN